jgi:hypothetical protein
MAAAKQPDDPRSERQSPASRPPSRLDRPVPLKHPLRRLRLPLPLQLPQRRLPPRPPTAAAAAAGTPAGQPAALDAAALHNTRCAPRDRGPAGRPPAAEALLRVPRRLLAHSRLHRRRDRKRKRAASRGQHRASPREPRGAVPVLPHLSLLRGDTVRTGARRRARRAGQAVGKRVNQE